MMNVAAILMLVVSSNLDDLAVGFSIGIHKKIPISIITTIAVFSGTAMAIGIGAGGYFSGFIPKGLNDLISALVFLAFGVYFVLTGLKDGGTKTRNPVDLSMKMGILIGATLSANSLILGISAGLVGYSLVFTSLAAFIVSFTFILIGSLFGNLLQPLLKQSDMISGILLILLAFAVLLTPL